MALIRLFVITLNWNLKDDTIACVESVLAAGTAPENVIVVDNGSADGSVQALTARFGPALHQVCNMQNLGFAGGMNAGIRYAQELGSTSVLLLNNDTVISPTMIDLLLEAGGRLSGPAILGPAIYYHDDPERLWRLGDVRHRWLPMPLSVKAKSKRAAGPEPFPVDYVTGCGMLVPTELFERIGYLDRRYFMYFEDADFCRRARDAGYSVWCVPQAVMWHKVSLSAQRDRPLNRYHRALNQVRFYHEHQHGPSALLRGGYILVKLLKTMAEDLWHGDRHLIHPLLTGTLDGYREQWRRKHGSSQQEQTGAT